MQYSITDLVKISKITALSVLLPAGEERDTRSSWCGSEGQTINNTVMDKGRTFKLGIMSFIPLQVRSEVQANHNICLHAQWRKTRHLQIVVHPVHYKYEFIVISQEILNLFSLRG